MIISVLKESQDPRVALIPKTVAKLVKEGYSVWMESNAGARAFFTDEAFQEAGASVHSRADILKESDILLCIAPPDKEVAEGLKSGAITILVESPDPNSGLADTLTSNSTKGFSLYDLPRTTRAQAMDVLSSMANIAGYRAVLIAASHLPRYFPLLMTAAGTIPPARVLVLGAGVAGLQAIATARRLGARVEAFDVRAATKEEVESLGAKFVEVEGADDNQTSGYAKEQSKEFLDRQRAVIREHIAMADVVITTAQVRGRKAPILVDEEALGNMKSGAVIVDLAASSGGNCVRTED
ncbi:MAG: NAD(P) transhydrogenase subunit alpha, partial [Bacteroidota bacterium]